MVLMILDVPGRLTHHKTALWSSVCCEDHDVNVLDLYLYLLAQPLDIWHNQVNLIFLTICAQ